MKMKYISLFPLLFLVGSCISLFWLVLLKETPALLTREEPSSEEEFIALLKNVLPEDARIIHSHTKINKDIKYAVEIILPQPLDHNDLGKGYYFDQHIYLSHVGFNQPVVFETEGYWTSGNQYREISKELNANQIVVEYRYYGKSKPKQSLSESSESNSNSMNEYWKYLTNDNANDDYHRIVTLLKNDLYYKEKWTSTGISKGGVAALTYRYKYPNDVDATVAYVSPFNIGLEDPRISFNVGHSVGDEVCSKRIVQFQRTVLQRKTELLGLLRNDAHRYKRIGLEAALEYSVLEYPFSFWQWGHKCTSIPDVDTVDVEDSSSSITAHQLLYHLNSVCSGGIQFFSDHSIQLDEPMYYQNLRESGYYGFDLTPVQDLLSKVNSTTNSQVFAPQLVGLGLGNDDENENENDVIIKFDPTYVPSVVNWLETYGEQIIYIYGGNDPWTSTGINIDNNDNNPKKKKLDAMKLVLKDGSHQTRINNFPKETQNQIYSTLRRWLDIERETTKSKDEPLWKGIVDPKTGKTYYYHLKTRETTWIKPKELRA